MSSLIDNYYKTGRRIRKRYVREAKQRSCTRGNVHYNDAQSRGGGTGNTAGRVSETGNCLGRLPLKRKRARRTLRAEWHITGVQPRGLAGSTRLKCSKGTLQTHGRIKRGGDATRDPGRGSSRMHQQPAAEKQKTLRGIGRTSVKPWRLRSSASSAFPRARCSD